MESQVSFGKIKSWKYGDYYMPFIQEEIDKYVGVYRDLPQVPLGEEDVVVSSFPKSGTTWVSEIVYLLNNGMNTKEAQSRVIEDRVPFLEYTYPGIDAILSTPQPRIIKSHLPYSMLPQTLRHNKGKIIYIARNPMDVAVSYYYFIRMQCTTSYTGTFQQLFAMFVNGTVIYGPWWKHVTEYWDHRDDDNLLFITYEDLHENPTHIIKVIAQFLGKHLSEVDIEKLCELTSFTNMKKNDSVNYSWWNREGRRNTGETDFFRKGIVGDWKNHFTPEMAEQINTILQDYVTPKGLQFRVELVKST